MRKCGYCRDVGHMMPDCKLRLEQIDMIRRHVVMQRQDIARLMPLNGFGIGAIVNAYDYLSGEEIPCILTQDSLDTAMSQNFVEYRIVKYSKQARATLLNYSGRGYEELNNNLVTSVERSGLAMTVTPLDPMHPTGKLPCTLHISDLKIGGVTNTQGTKRDGWWSRYCELLSPSSEGEPSKVALLFPVHLHERIGNGERLIQPVLT